MALPKIGETISKEDFNQLPSVGETISAEQFNSLGGGIAPKTEEKVGFLQSLLTRGKRVETKEESRANLGNVLDKTAKVGKFLGFQPLGETIAKTAFEKIPAVRGADITPEQAKEVSKESFEEFTPKEVTSSAALFAANILLPGLGGKVLKPFISGQKLSSTARSAALASTFSGLHAASQNKPEEEILSHAITGAMFGVPLPIVSALMQKVGSFVTKTIPVEFFKRAFPTTKKDILQRATSEAKGKEINPILAREAMERGFKGDNAQMLIRSIRDIDGFESQLQNVVKSSKKVIPIDKSRYTDLVKSGVTGYKEGILPLGEDQGNKMLQILGKEGNTLKLDEALQIRRFLDSARSISSFKLNPNLSFKQEGLKLGADELRKNIAKTSSAAAKLLKEERIRIQIRDVIVDKEFTAQNKAFVSFQDILLGGGGVAVGGFNPLTLGPMFFARGLQTPKYLTSGGLFLDQAGKAAQAVFSKIQGPTLFRQATFPTVGKVIGGNQ